MIVMYSNSLQSHLNYTDREEFSKDSLVWNACDSSMHEQETSLCLRWPRDLMKEARFGQSVKLVLDRIQF